MAHKDFNMVLRFDSANPKVYDTLLELIKDHARQIETTAKLLHGGLADGSPPPEVKLYSDDFFLGTEDIELKDSAEAAAHDADEERKL